MDKQIIGSRYKIIQPLSKGGFGTTYLAEDTKYPDNLKCVVKKLHSNAYNPEFPKIARRMFDREAKTLAKLGKHSQIPQLLAYFEEDEEFYLIQQYIRGVTLTDELTLDRTWSEAKIIEFLQDLLIVVDFIHQNGVIHRDLKPDNLIRRVLDNKLVLVDFGAVKEVMLPQSPAAVSTMAIGTHGYMPTEQARGKPRFASDIYAVGMITVQALTGIHPLQLPEDENGETLWQEQAKCSPLLAEIVSKMIRYHFKDRYHSAREIITNLDILKDRPGDGINRNVTNIVMTSGQTMAAVNGITPGVDPTTTIFQSQPRKKMPLALGGVGVLAALILGGVYVLSSGGFKSPELKQAEAKAASGEYVKAIALVQNLSPTSEIEQRVDDWSEQVLIQAQDRYAQKGDLETAGRMIRSIPASSSTKEKGQKLLASWQQEHELNQSILQIATENLQQEQWSNAQQEAAQIRSNTPYWQQQSEKIINAAQLGKESPAGIIDLCSRALDFCN